MSGETPSRLPFGSDRGNIGESERLRPILDGQNGTDSGACKYPEKSMQ